MPAELANAKSIFLGAVSRPAGPGRDAFLAEACAADPALRREVDGLLAHHEQAGDFLAGTALTATADAPPAEAAGAVIGRYKLVERIGEGGMGEVWLAHQTDPVKRPVALKVIKAGMDTKAVLARFEAERQALALMDHPNIAKVLDGGATPGGRPYFVMELVKGTPITKFCDEHRLTPRQRLELFVQICQAVQHAHQKGVIHRDLKPSNVLVAPYDGKPVPKVIDFGVAKAAGVPLTEKTLVTGFGAVVGTPEYMSPEQAELNNQDIDTRSDVYSLGILLYELLTGSTPLTRRRAKEAALFEVLRLVREEEPPRPSTRLSTTDELPSIAASRGLEPKRLTGLIRGELDWIVMKALEKDRARRYETASAFATDVQRYLHDEPVHACPPSTWYRFRKWVRRHPAAVWSAVVVSTCVLLSLAVVFRIRQQAALDLADLERAARERLELTLYSRTVAGAEREQATGNVGRAEELLDGCPPALRQWEWHYLKRQRFGGPSPADLGTHLNCVAASPDGRWLAVGGNDGTVRLWDPAGWREVGRLVHGSRVCGLAFRPDSRRIASAGEDGRVWIWEVDGGHRVRAVSHEGEALCVAFSPDGTRLLTGGARAAFVWDAATGERLYELHGHTPRVLAVAFGPDGRLAATAGENDRLVKVWDARTWEEVRTLGPHVSPVLGVAFHPDGRRLAAASGHLFMTGDDCDVQVWDADTGKAGPTLRGHQGAVLGLAFSPDGRRLVSSGAEDATIKVWDVASGLELVAVHGHRDAVWAVTFGPDGHRLYSVGADHALRLWDGTPVDGDGSALRTFPGHSARVTSVAFDRDVRRLVSGCMDGVVRVWDLPTGRLLRQMGGAGAPVHGVAFNPGGDLLAAAAWPTPAAGPARRPVRVWDTRTWAERPIEPPESDPDECVAVAVAFRPAGGLVAADGGTLWVFDGPEFRGSPVTYDHCTQLTAMALRRDGRHAAVTDVNGEIWVWDLADPRLALAVLPGPGPAELGNVAAAMTARPTRRFSANPDHPTRATGVAYSPAADVLATCSMDGAVRLWDAVTYRLLNELHGHINGVRCLAFSPDGTRLVTGGNDATVRVWDVAGRRSVAVLRGHTDVVYGIAFSRDGRYIASGSLDKTVKVWEAPAGDAGR
jgi:WD40 repeat protein/serine/threonine protein kinase